MTSVYIDGDKEFVNINGGDGDNDGREGDGPEPPQATRAPLQEQQTPILDGELELPPTRTTTSILDGNSDLKQKMEHVLRNLCSGQYGSLLLQFWKLIEMDGLFFLKTQTSYSFLVTSDDALSRYWKSSEKSNTKLDGPFGVLMSDGDGALTYLWLPVYLPVSEQGSYEANCVGMLEIVSNTKDTCLQFFKEAHVCDLFQKAGLICSDVVPQHLGMQCDVSTQGSEVPSKFSVDHTGQFTTKEVFNSIDELFTWARDVGNSDLKQKMEHVVRNLCSGQYGPLLLQFRTLIKMDGRFFLKTQTSHSFLVTPDDALSQYWEVSCDQDISLLGLSRVSMSDFEAFTSLLLPVYLPVREQGLYKENCVGMLEILSNTKETCVQFFKEARVCDLFQKKGLICSDVPQHLGMQLDVSTQGSEVPSNISVDHTGQFTTKEVFKSKVQLVNWARDVGKNNGFVVVTRSSYDDKVYLRCKGNGQTSAKKWNCDFAIKGQKSKENGKWSLEVIRGCHNHLTRTI